MPSLVPALREFSRAGTKGGARVGRLPGPNIVWGGRGVGLYTHRGERGRHRKSMISPGPMLPLMFSRQEPRNVTNFPGFLRKVAISNKRTSRSVYY